MKIIVLELTKKLEINHIKKMVGVEGFEPPTLPLLVGSVEPIVH